MRSFLFNSFTPDGMHLPIHMYIVHCTYVVHTYRGGSLGGKVKASDVGGAFPVKDKRVGAESLERGDGGLGGNLQVL